MDTMGKKNYFRLSCLPLRKQGIVASIKAEGFLRGRLLDLGFVPGTVVEPVRRSPLGDPTAYRIRGTVIALRYLLIRLKGKLPAILFVLPGRMLL